MSGQNSSHKKSEPIGITMTLPVVNRPRQRLPQNYLVVWVDASIDERSEEYQNILEQLQNVISNVEFFADPEQCVEFLQNINDEKIFLIIPGYLGQKIMPQIHAITQLHTIYVFCGNKSRHERWAKQWSTINGVYTEIQSICEVLQVTVKQCDQDFIPMSFVTKSEATSHENLNELEPSFMYTQVFKKILLEMEHDHRETKDLADYCRQLYSDNIGELNIINEFERDYHPKSAIWWYTRECFTYQMLNRALRLMEADRIIKMGFFIRDLHLQIQQLYSKQIGNHKHKYLIVYRGQGLLKADFEKLLKAQGGLMSFNNFLSTSTKQEISLSFAQSALFKPNMVGILFRISVDMSISSSPFAAIKEVSYFQTEEEILFSMHTIFCISEIKQIHANEELYQVELQLTADNDEQRHKLTERIKQEAAGETGWQRLGNLLLKIGQIDKAEELFTVLLEQTSNEDEKALYYNQLGYTRDQAGDYEKALWYHEKARENFEKNFDPDDPLLAASYNNIATAYKNMGEYPKALSFYEKALEIFEKTLPPDHELLATSYNNIGMTYDSMGQYARALTFHEKAQHIHHKTLPFNHPTLATSYSNIGLVYRNMEDYPKALSLFQKAFKIYEKTLPQDHFLLATSYNNIGSAHDSLGEHSEAIQFYEKALEIFEKTLPSNHPSLVSAYSNIGMTYYNMREYSKALQFQEKSLEIFEKTLPANHPVLAIAYGNIGSTYHSMGELSKALLVFEKSLQIYENTPSSNHLPLANGYYSIGALYEQMGEYSKSLSYFEQALNTFKISFPENHPYLITIKQNIEKLKQKL